MSELSKPTFGPFQSLFYGCGINYPRCKEDCYWYMEEQDMCAHIPYCQSKGGKYIEPEDCENCEHYRSKYIKTKADRIRAMTDEELAEFIGRDPMNDICPNNCENDRDRPCRACALDWLRQEVEEGE